MHIVSNTHPRPYPPPTSQAIFAFAAGAVLPVQAAINRRLAHIHLKGDKLMSAMISFFVGSITLAIVSSIVTGVYLRTSTRSLWHIQGSSAWLYTGGLFGATFVFAMMKLAPIIGMARMFMCVVLGQLISSLLYDHFAILGVAQRTATPMRIAGVCLVLCAAITSSLL